MHAIAKHGEAAVTSDEAARQGEWRAAMRKARRWLERRNVDFDARALLEETVSEIS